MNSRTIAAVCLSIFACSAFAQNAPERPKITGISHLAIYASDPVATEHYYVSVIGAVKQPDPENAQGARYALSSTQFVEVLPLPANAGISRFDHAGLNTTSAEGMRKYLAAKGWKVPARVMKAADGSQWFEVLDPEGNKIQFVQPSATAKVDAPHALGHHIIHVGFLVKDRAKEDTFYRDLLGFRPYWYGGMTDTEIDWVSQQTPDSRDWIEYMLMRDPAKATQRQLGVMNHMAIGETSVFDTFKTLTASNRLGQTHDQTPKMGKDGKGQFNMYDPDGTRLELMNLRATEKPCCSAFTAEDPAE
ncbi:MAG TPA: VOC family protein [Terracidiphilus sp.]|jgi:catechol 2,3-dioxygenase-like lactoylglutathione lyase family enzyme|nr:VOC family protein [Terracidiphilus sp.]